MIHKKIEIRNRKASFLYEFLEKFIAGIQLTGTEIKSLRNGKISLTDAYCYFRDHELWVKNMHIAEYEYGTYTNHDPDRDRKLLLKRQTFFMEITLSSEVLHTEFSSWQVPIAPKRLPLR